MDEFTKLVSKLASVKGIVALLIVIVALIFLYQNLDFITEISFKVDRVAPSKEEQTGTVSVDTKSEEKRSSSPFLRVSNAYITPIRFQIPAALYFEVSNTGAYSSFDTTISIDVGRAEISTVDWVPKSVCQSESDPSSQPVLIITCPEIASKQTLYFQLLISEPEIREIVIRSEGLSIPRQYDTADLVDDVAKDEADPFFSSGLVFAYKAIFLIVSIVFILFFVFHIIAYLDSLIESARDKKKSDSGDS